MARSRDVIVAVIIIVSFLIAIGFFGLIFIGIYYGNEDMSIAGFGDRIAVVEVFDTIYDSRPVIRQLKKWGESDNVAAIVVHVNSPGGAVAPSQEIYEEILRIREEEGKVIVVSMSSVAASGGYLISCAADYVMANPGTITGSIGVIMRYPTVGKLFEKIGIGYQQVKSGQLKDVGAWERDMTPQERKMLTAMIMDTYEQFVDVVAEGRQMAREDVYPLADGSVFSGRQAYQLGLVDTLGGFEDAVRLAADLAGIGENPRIVREYRKKDGFWDILGSFAGNLEEITELDFSAPQILYLY